MRTNCPDERILRILGGEDPVTEADFFGSERSEEAQRLLTSVLASARAPGSRDAGGRVRPRSAGGAGHSWRGPALIAASMVAAAILLVGVLVNFGSGPGRTTRVTTPWQAGQAFHGGSHGRSGQWQLVDEVLSGTWQQNPSGPPGGGVCPTASACYVMAGHYSSASAATPASESFYASADVGSTWSVFPMPPGFIGTTRLSCAAATVCAAGGTYQGNAVLVSTTDGGHSFVISPLPKGVGTLYALSCPTAAYCGGLAATRTWGGIPHDIPVDASFLSTSDGGNTFADAPIFAGESMHQLVCSSSTSCIVTGQADGPTYKGLGPTTGPSVVGVTTDGGRTWTHGVLPSGLTVTFETPLSCPDAAHCYLAGRAPSAAKPQTTIQIIVTSDNGGLTWTAEPAPASAPHLGIFSMSCPTDNECWVAGNYQAKSSSGDSPVLLGTTNGGATWSRVTFSVPAGAPNYDGQSYIAMGQISCAAANVCVAWGAIAQGSPTAPVYSLRS